MKAKTRRTEIHVETHEIKIIRFGTKRSADLRTDHDDAGDVQPQGSSPQRGHQQITRNNEKKTKVSTRRAKQVSKKGENQ
jgi:hypothetical protein